MVTAEQAKANLEDGALRSRLVETASLEAARHGEAAGRVPVGAPLHLRTRDGVASLLSAGSITQAEAEAALAYRHCFEACAAGLKSGLAETSGGGRVMSVLGRDPAALRRSMLMTKLNQMERAVGAVIEDGRELLALRLVAGEGQTIRAIAGGAKAGGNVKAAYIASLKRALGAVSTTLTKTPLANRAR